jgi:hypothetical protein
MESSILPLKHANVPIKARHVHIVPIVSSQQEKNALLTTLIADVLNVVVRMGCGKSLALRATTTKAMLGTVRSKLAFALHAPIGLVMLASLATYGALMLCCLSCLDAIYSANR